MYAAQSLYYLVPSLLPRLPLGKPLEAGVPSLEARNQLGQRLYFNLEEYSKYYELFFDAS